VKKTLFILMLFPALLMAEPFRLKTGEAGGQAGEIQYNSGGTLAGLSNVWFDVAAGKIVARPTDPLNFFSLYNGATNAAGCTPSNRVIRVGNSSGVGEIELYNNGQSGFLFRGNGSMFFMGQPVDFSTVFPTNVVTTNLVVSTNLTLTIQGGRITGVIHQ
jgi:hypothetical protein